MRLKINDGYNKHSVEKEVEKAKVMCGGGERKEKI